MIGIRQKLMLGFGGLLEMNQRNMNEANNAARRQADTAHRIMMAAITVSAFLALLFNGYIQQFNQTPGGEVMPPVFYLVLGLIIFGALAAITAACDKI